MSQTRDDLLNQLKLVALEKISQNLIPLPSLPRAVTEALRVLRLPDYEYDEVARAIGTDAVTSAQILRTANSVAFAGFGAATTLGQAIARVGKRSLEQFLLEVAARSVFSSKNDRINQSFRALWHHSVATALTSREIARARGGHPELVESAYLAGLLHDIGKPILAAFLMQTEERLVGAKVVNWMDANEWLTIINGSHRTIGLLLAATWNMTIPIREAIANSTEFQHAEPHSISNYVSLANLITKRAGIYVGTVNDEQVQSLIETGSALIGLSLKSIDELQQRVSDEVNDRLKDES
ncbi:MAG: HDOD domain-containing protein [Deltaproteobacteria bacterium]|nr:HDOD domain-containing protein [Deltaproteobacteria bacterium]